VEDLDYLKMHVIFNLILKKFFENENEK